MYKLSEKLLEIIRCPVCVKEKEGLLEYYREAWFVCNECGRKYPIVEEIPVMLISEGDKWIKMEKEQLPVPPPKIK